MPISSHCFCPCDSVPAMAARWSASPMTPSTSSIRSRCGRRQRARTASARTTCRRRSASSRFSNTDRNSKTVGFWNFRPMPACAISGSDSASRSMFWPNQAEPVVRTRLPGDDVHHRRLAGAVRADDAAQLAGIDVERQPVERLEAVEADGQLLEVENLAEQRRRRPARRRFAHARARRCAARRAAAASSAASRRHSPSPARQQPHERRAAGTA